MFRHIHQVTRVSGGSLSAALQVVKASEAYFLFCHTLMCQSYICHTPLRTDRRLWQVRGHTSGEQSHYEAREYACSEPVCTHTVLHRPKGPAQHAVRYL